MKIHLLYFKIYFPLKFKMVDSRVRLWPNSHFFDAGIVQSHEKLNLINSERIIKYSMTKVIFRNSNLAHNKFFRFLYQLIYQGIDGGWPVLEWPIWRHMAVEKLKLSEDLAWTYFEFFDALQESNHYERQIKADQRRSQTFRLVLEYIN